MRSEPAVTYQAFLDAQSLGPAVGDVTLRAALKYAKGRILVAGQEEFDLVALRLAKFAAARWGEAAVRDLLEAA